MSKRKRKLTPCDRAQKKRMREKYEMVLLNGKQKRIKRMSEIEEIPDDPISLIKHEMHEELHKWEMERDGLDDGASDAKSQDRNESLPF